VQALRFIAFDEFLEMRPDLRHEPPGFVVVSPAVVDQENTGGGPCRGQAVPAGPIVCQQYRMLPFQRHIVAAGDSLFDRPDLSIVRIFCRRWLPTEAAQRMQHGNRLHCRKALRRLGLCLQNDFHFTPWRRSPCQFKKESMCEMLCVIEVPHDHCPGAGTAGKPLPLQDDVYQPVDQAIGMVKRVEACSLVRANGFGQRQIFRAQAVAILRQRQMELKKVRLDDFVRACFQQAQIGCLDKLLHAGPGAAAFEAGIEVKGASPGADLFRMRRRLRRRQAGRHRP
jgi:hypothetical protein